MKSGAKSGAGTGAKATAPPLAPLETSRTKRTKVICYQCGTGAVANYSQKS
jgi:hypothetical protein